MKTKPGVKTVGLKAAAALLLRQVLPDYDVIFYDKTKHVHIEYQRYLDMDRESSIEFGV